MAPAIHHSAKKDHDIYKQRLTAAGVPIKEAAKHDVKKTTKLTHQTNTSCMTCYGAEDTPEQCCNTCDEVGLRTREVWV